MRISANYYIICFNKNQQYDDVQRDFDDTAIFNAGMLQLPYRQMILSARRWPE